MKSRFAYIAVFLTALVSACNRPGGASTLARANEETVSADEFRSRLFEYRMGVPANIAASPEEILLKKKILNELIEEKLLLAEARKMKVSVSDDQVDDVMSKIVKDYPGESFDERLKQQHISKARFKDRIRTNATIEKLVQAVTKDVPAPSDGQIQKYYNEHMEDFHVAEQFHLLQIVVKTQEDADQILAELKEGKSFTELATTHSFATDAAQGGDLGFVSKGALPKEVDDELGHLQIDKPSKAIQSDYGFHILKLMEKKPARQIPVAEASAIIIQQLTQKEREERFSAFRKELLSKARIERNHALLASIN